MIDVGLTHVALPVSNLEKSIKFYSTYAGMEIVHRRLNTDENMGVVWLSDGTRPFVIVLIQTDLVHPILSPIAHLGVGCQSRESMDRLCEEARQEGVLISGPQDAGEPVGYWAYLRDPDGHTLELSHGQQVGITVQNSNLVE